MDRKTVLRLVLVLALLLLNVYTFSAHAVTLPVVPSTAVAPVSALPPASIMIGPTTGYTVSTVSVGAPALAQPSMTVSTPWRPYDAFGAPAPMAPTAITFEPSAGAVAITEHIPVAIAPPVGAPVSAAAAAAAAGGAGVGALASTAVYNRTATLAAADVGGMAKTALKGAGVVAAAFAAPEIVGALVALQVGQVGYNWYQDFKSKGVVLAPDGSASVLSSAFYYTVMNGYGSPFPSASSACSYFATNQGGSVQSAAVGSAGCVVVFPSGSTVTGWLYSNPQAQTSTPATQADVDTALAAVAAGSAAADAASWAYLNKAPIPAGIQFSSPAEISLASDFVKTRSQTTSIGTVTDTLLRNEATISPSSVPGSPPDISTISKEVTVVNGSPTSSTSTPTINSLSLPIPLSIPTGSAGAPNPSDICVLHPDILACSNDANLSDVPLAPLGVKNINVVITPVVVPSNLICPAPFTFMTHTGLPVTVDMWSGACTTASAVKPLVLAFAWLAAAMIIFAGRPLTPA